MVTKLLPQYTAPPPIPVLSPHDFCGGVVCVTQSVADEHDTHMVPGTLASIALQSYEDSQPLVASRSLLNLPFRHVERVVQTESEEHAIHVVSVIEIALQL